jgi:hypothetical protein
MGSVHDRLSRMGWQELDRSARTGWSDHTVFASPEMKVFDFCVSAREGSFGAIFARFWLGAGTPPNETGLWWCRADTPSSSLSEWSKPVQIMTAEDREWHSGPWKPSFQFPVQNGDRALVFFNGCYRTSDPGPFPFAFTLGCAEMSLPDEA